MLTKKLISRWLSEVDDAVCELNLKMNGMRREIAELKREIVELKNPRTDAEAKPKRKPVAEEKRVRTKRGRKPASH